MARLPLKQITPSIVVGLIEVALTKSTAPISSIDCSRDGDCPSYSIVLVQPSNQSICIRNRMVRLYLHHSQIWKFYTYDQKFVHFFDGMRRLQGVIKLSSIGILLNVPHFRPGLLLLLFGRRPLSNWLLRCRLITAVYIFERFSMVAPGKRRLSSLLCTASLYTPLLLSSRNVEGLLRARGRRSLRNGCISLFFFTLA